MTDMPDTLTPVETSQDRQRYNRIDLVPWGRLISYKMGIHSIDLLQDDFKFGRSQECTVIAVSGQFNSAEISAISKEHFHINRNVDDNLIYITDLSKNGTFINQNIIGKNRKRILKNHDIISISTPNRLLYHFIKQGIEGVDDFLPESLEKKYAHVRLLGSGSCGEVRLVKDRITFKDYAVKKIILADSTLSKMNKINAPQKVRTEIEILKSMKHPFVIDMKEFIETDKVVYIVLEYMAGGELSERINYVTEDNARLLFYQMVMAVNYLHQNGVAHRDLKPENILLYDSSDETLVKITDFGLSKIFTAQSAMATMCGTLRYAAPEIISNQVSRYGKEVDIWSLGVILYYMLTKKLPFDSFDKQLIAKKIVRGFYKFDEEFATVSTAAKNLIQQMLVLDPRKRIKIKQILQHPWITQDKQLKTKIQALLDKNGVAANRSNEETATIEPPTKRIKVDTTNDKNSSAESCNSEPLFDFVDDSNLEELHLDSSSLFNDNNVTSDETAVMS